MLAILITAGRRNIPGRKLFLINSVESFSCFVCVFIFSNHVTSAFPITCYRDHHSKFLSVAVFKSFEKRPLSFLFPYFLRVGKSFLGAVQQFQTFLNFFLWFWSRNILLCPVIQNFLPHRNSLLLRRYNLNACFQLFFRLNPV